MYVPRFDIVTHSAYISNSHSGARQLSKHLYLNTKTAFSLQIILIFLLNKHNLIKSIHIPCLIYLKMISFYNNLKKL